MLTTLLSMCLRFLKTDPQLFNTDRCLAHSGTLCRLDDPEGSFERAVGLVVGAGRGAGRAQGPCARLAARAAESGGCARAQELDIKNPTIAAGGLRQ